MLGSDFDRMLRSIQAANERKATERGFASVEAMIEADDAEEKRARLVERERQARAHREHVVAAFGGRLRPSIAEALVEGHGLGDTSAVQAARAWLRGSRPVLVLSGGTGTGKTVAAAWSLCERPSAFQVLRAVRVGAAFERWQNDREEGVDALRLYVPTLLLDDLGQESLDDRRVEPAIEEIFDARQSPRLRTIVTTNLSTEAMRSRYSDRVISRLAQNATVIRVDGADLRRVSR